MSASVGDISALTDFSLTPPGENEDEQLLEDDEVKKNGEEEEDEDKLKCEKEVPIGPQFSLKEQLENDKDDESLQRWKQLLLGNVDFSAVGERKEPQVHIVSLSIQLPDRGELVLPIPYALKPKATAFTLKEGCRYRLKISFTVSNNLVSGLKYVNTVWKAGVRVESTRVMLGTFSPQKEPYSCLLEEETTPSGMFARGFYSARSKFLDDDRNCFLEINYHFEIQKKWPSKSFA